MPFASMAAVVMLASTPYCPAGHSQSECDAIWSAAQAVAAERHRSSDQGVRAAATAARYEITKDLADPESARFRNVRAFQTQAGGDIFFCGEINAKNQFGAYTGYRPFVAGGGLGEIAGLSDEPLLAELQTKMVVNACTASPAQSYGMVKF
jgi:hypothetical protein